MELTDDYGNPLPVYWHYACGEYHAEGHCAHCPYCGERLRESDGQCAELWCRVQAEEEKKK